MTKLCDAALGRRERSTCRQPISDRLERSSTIQTVPWAIARRMERGGTLTNGHHGRLLVGVAVRPPHVTGPLSVA